MTFTASTVAEAATQLDALRPGWYDEIDVAQLDMSSFENCVLGQLYGDFNHGKSIIELTDFEAPTYRQTVGLFCTGAREWWAEIKKRRTLTTDTLSKSEVRDALLSADLHAEQTAVDALLTRLGLEPRVALPTGRNALVETEDGITYLRANSNMWVSVGGVRVHDHIMQNRRIRRVIFPGE